MAPKLNIGVLIFLFSSFFFVSIPSIYGESLIDSLRFYAHENETVYEVARASITSGSPSSFGLVRVVDNLLTELPDRNSREIGRVQGLITSADLEKTALTVYLNFVFTTKDSKPTKTTLSVLGRCEMDQEVLCDMPVVGGSGAYRMTRGFAFSTVYSPGVVRYDVSVIG